MLALDTFCLYLNNWYVYILGGEVGRKLRKKKMNNKCAKRIYG